MDSMAIEKEQGPSWARPHWPVTALDSNNDGLDPTEATIEKIVEGAKAAATAGGRDRRSSGPCRPPRTAFAR